MRKFTVFYIILLLIIVLPSQTLMVRSKAFYPSHDGLIHIQRIEEFHASIIHGQVPPRITYYLNEGIGYPMFVANYQLPYYFAEIFMLITSDPVFSFKTVLSLTYILSIVFMFLVLKNFGGALASLCGAIVFAYLPYRFANLYTRAAFGESVAIMFVPLTLLTLNLISKNKKNGTLLFAFSVFGLITSHTIIFVLFVPFLIAYLLFFIKTDKKMIKKIIAGFLLSIGLSSFQLFPVIFERKYLRLEETFLQVYSKHYINIYQLLRIPKEGINMGSAYQIGIGSLMVIISSFISLLIKRSKYLSIFLVFIFTSLFMILPISSWLWDYSLLLKYIIFPWRFLSIIILSTAFLTTYLVNNFKFKKFIAVFIILTSIYSSRHYFLKPTQFSSTPTSVIPGFPNEYDTIWTKDNTYKVQSLVTTKPHTNIQNLTNDGSKLSFSLRTSKLTDVIIRKIYFPGWTLKINGVSHKLSQTDGLIHFQTAPGNWVIKIYLSETPVRKIGDFITLLSLVLLIVFFISNISGKLYLRNKINYLRMRQWLK